VTDSPSPNDRRDESAASSRPRSQWPAWVSDVLAFAPIAELEAEWRAEIGDAITAALDLRNGSRVIKCACCGATKVVPQ
jgi:LSD1 subclass zinc finger protein